MWSFGFQAFVNFPLASFGETALLFILGVYIDWVEAISLQQESYLFKDRRKSIVGPYPLDDIVLG